MRMHDHAERLLTAGRRELRLVPIMFEDYVLYRLHLAGKWVARTVWPVYTWLWRHATWMRFAPTFVARSVAHRPLMAIADRDDLVAGRTGTLAPPYAAMRVEAMLDSRAKVLDRLARLEAEHRKAQRILNSVRHHAVYGDTVHIVADMVDKRPSYGLPAGSDTDGEIERAKGGAR